MATLEALGKYEIRRTLGRGAASIVYEGWDPAIQRRVAIKAVQIGDLADPETEELIGRFRREAQAAGRLVHPHIVTVYDYGETPELAFIVMEFIEGPTLRTLLERHERFSVQEIARIMEDILAALEFSHERGVIHRDIKPANVMLTGHDSATRRAKLADFGIARIESSNLTQAGTIMGTPSYMSPEQFLGDAVDARSDIYSAGVLLYQLLTGERPFEGTISAIIHKVLNTQAPAPSRLTNSSPPGMDFVVRKAISKRPEDRFPSAAAFARAIRTAMSPAVPPVSVPDVTERTVVELPPRPVAAPIVTPAMEAAKRRNRWPLWAGAALALAIVGGGAGWFLLHSANPTARIETARGEPQRPGASLMTPGATVQGRDPSNESPPGSLTVSTPTGPVATAPASPVAPVPTGAVPATPLPAPAPMSPTQTPSIALTTQVPAPVAPTPIPVPVLPAAPGVTVEQVRGEVAMIVAGLRCALIQGQVNGQMEVTISGVAGPGVEEAFRASHAARATPGSFQWQVSRVDGGFCPMLDVLRTAQSDFGTAGSRVTLTLAGDRMVLRDGDSIRPRLVMPSTGGFLRVAYLSHDGGVQHLFPQTEEAEVGIRADQDRAFAPAEWVSLGDPQQGHRGWEASEPFGVDLVVAITSSRPLFDPPRPRNTESAVDFVRALRQAVQALLRDSGTAAASAIAVEVLPRR
jgi:serine/threonine-protein kinase